MLNINRILIGVIVALALSFVVSLFVIENKVKVVRQQEADILHLETRVNELQKEMQLRQELSEVYKRLSEDQADKLKNLEAKFDSMKTALDKALQNNPQWSNTPLPEEVKNVLKGSN